MKKIISRILIILIIFLLLFDFVFASQYRFVYADGPGETFVAGVTSLASGIVAIVYTLLKALIVGATYGVQVIVTVTASSYGINTDNKWYETAAETVLDPITPMDIFFNKYKLTDINFFDFEGIEKGSFIYLFRESIAEWYTIMKLIACAILLVILIYVGIRMALSTIADDKAKYKKMFADWVVSLLLIFILQYIIIFTIYCNDAIVKAIESAFANNEMASAVSDSIVKIGIQGIINPGIISFASVLVYIFIVFQTIIFLLAYLKRMVKVGFLIMISPLITITYSIDKMGDGKAQALGNWLKEFVYTILIQPFHCIIYIALAQTAIELLQGTESISIFDVTILNSIEYNQLAAGVLAIMCLKFVNDAEQIVRKIFGFKDDGSTGMGAGAAIGLAALANAQKIGGATRKSLNKFKANPYVRAIGKDFSDIKGRVSNRGAKIAGKAKKAGSAVAKKAGNAFAGTKVGSKVVKAAKGTAEKAKANKENRDKKKENKKLESKPKKKKGLIRNATSNIGKYIKGKASMSTALGVMAAAMKYSAGDSSAIEATTYGLGVQKGSQEFFSSSTGTMYKDIKAKREASEAYAHKKQIDSKMNESQTDFSEGAKKAIQAHKELASLNAQKKAISDKRKDMEAKRKELEEKKGTPGASQDDIDTLKDEIGKLEDEINSFDEVKNEEDIAKAKEVIEEYDADGNLVDKEGNVHEDFKQWRTDAESRFKDGRKDRFISSTTGPSTRELDDTKNKIIAKLREIKKADKGNGKVGFDSKLTVDEEANIESVAQTLIDNITVGVLRDKGFGQEAQKQLVASQLGLQDSGDNKLYEGINDLFNITEQCEEQARQKAIAADYAHVRSYDTTGEGIAQNELLNRELKAYGDE